MKSFPRRAAAVIGLLVAPVLATTACAKAQSLVAPIGDTPTASATADPSAAASPATDAATPDATASDPAATGSPSDQATPGSTDPGAASPSAQGVTMLPAVTRRSVVYGQFDVTVLRAEVAGIEPDTFADPTRSPQPSTTPYAFLEVKVHNRLNFNTAFIAFDEVALDLGDGTPIPMDSGLGKATDIVDRGATNSGWYAYPVPAGTTLAGAKLVFGKAGFQQEVLPLTGTVPPPAFPKPVTLRSPGLVTGPGNDVPKFTVTIGKASLSNAAAFDRDGSSEVPKRSLTGHRMLYFEFTAKPSAGTTNATFAYSMARLSIDGEVQSGSPLVSDSFNLQTGEVHHGVYVFDVPTTGKVALLWGTKAVAVPVPVS